MIRGRMVLCDRDEGRKRETRLVLLDLAEFRVRGPVVEIWKRVLDARPKPRGNAQENLDFKFQQRRIRPSSSNAEQIRNM